MNKQIFVTTPKPPPANAINNAGGTAYALSDREALAQYALTGCINDTYYGTAEDQLAAIRTHLQAVALEPGGYEYIAKLAIYARREGYMKDLPALLVAYLTAQSNPYAKAVGRLAFKKVIDNGKMLRNYVQAMRSGVFGRKSLGTAPKRLVLEWLAERTDDQVFKASVGNSPSLADVIKMVHPKPANETRGELYAYLLGKGYNTDKVPALVREFETYKTNHLYRCVDSIPDVPFEMLTALDLTTGDWKDIAGNAGWQWTRMNLNTLLRHGCFKDEAFTQAIANRLRNPELVRKARVFPYQLLSAYLNTSDDLPLEIRNALQDALEVATENVPELPRVVVCLDVSGSTHTPVTGNRPGATSKVRCIDAEALIAASIIRRNPNTAALLCFSDDVVTARINPRDSVMTMAQQLASLPSGGTNCSAPLRFLNAQNHKADLVVYVSDYESWVDAKNPRMQRYAAYSRGAYRSQATSVVDEWFTFKRNNPNAKLVNINLTPNSTTQASNSPDILNIGGFSDSVFDLLAGFASGSNKTWTEVIDAVQL